MNIFRIVAICGFFFFLSFEGIFASEEKPTRLIDLSPKENTELSWAVLTGTSVKLTEKKSNKVEKIIPKDDTPNESTVSEEDDKEKENISLSIKEIADSPAKKFQDAYKIGDMVKIIEGRPISKSKRWHAVYADNAQA